MVLAISQLLHMIAAYGDALRPWLRRAEDEMRDVVISEHKHPEHRRRSVRLPEMLFRPSWSMQDVRQLYANG